MNSPIVLECTQQEAVALQGLLDHAVRHGGLSVTGMAVLWSTKIEQAARASLLPTAQEVFNGRPNGVPTVPETSRSLIP